MRQGAILVVLKLFGQSYVSTFMRDIHLPRMSVHLEDGQRVYFKTDKPHKITLLAYFGFSKVVAFTRGLLYGEVPVHYV